MKEISTKTFMEDIGRQVYEKRSIKSTIFEEKTYLLLVSIRYVYE